MNYKLLADDGGYAKHKYFYKSPSPFNLPVFDSFASRADLTDDILFSVDNTDRIVFENSTYLIGDGASQFNIEQDKTNNELHRLCTYNSICRMIPNDKETHLINLVVGYPLNLYTKESKKQFTEYLKYKDKIDIIHNGIPKHFSINKCIVFPQTAGALYPNISYCKNQNVGVIDIGGLTAQGCVFSNLDIVTDSKFTQNLGCIILYNEIRKVLNKAFNINIQDYELPTTVQNGLLEHKEESLKLISEIKLKHILQIKNFMRMNNWNIENLRLLFIGGGSLVLEKEIRKLFPNAILSNDPIYDNVKGFYVVGEQYAK